MTQLNPPHPNASRVEWNHFLDRVEAMLASQSPISVEELTALGLLWEPACQRLASFTGELEKNQSAQRMRAPDGHYSEPDVELERLRDRLGALAGNLRPYAAWALAGTPNFAFDSNHERFIAVFAEARRRASEQTP